MRPNQKPTLAGPWILLIAVPLSIGHSSAQPSTVGKPTTAAQILALANDPNAKIDYAQVARVLDALAPADRQGAQRQLVSAPHQRLAATGASRAVRDKDFGAIELIVSNIPNWSADVQRGVMLNVVSSPNAFMDIPRGLIKSAIKSNKVIAPPDSPHEPLGMAAIILSRTGTDADRQLLLNLAQVRPRSWGTWVAIASAGAIDASRAAIASSVYKDVTVSIAVRVAAAAALEQLDSQAGTFALGQIQSFLSQCANQTVYQIIQPASYAAHAKPGDSAWRRAQDFRSNFHQLSVLLILHADKAQQLTFQHLNTANEDIQGLCEIVGALRWPDQLLKVGQGALTDKQYADLLATVATRHPELASAAAARTTPALMNAAKARVAKLGLGVFNAPGNMLTMF